MSDRVAYDHPMIGDLLEQGVSLHEVAGRLGHDYKRMRQAHWKWAKKAREGGEPVLAHGGVVVQQWLRTDEGCIHVKMPRPTEAPLTDDAEEVWGAFRDDAAKHAPHYDLPDLRRPRGEPCLSVINLYDSHFGLEAWGREIGFNGGVSQDLNIINADYRRMHDEAMALSFVYPTERYLLPLGHDLSHVNQYDVNGKGMSTRKGTSQDADGRLAKIFLTICRAAIYQIDTLLATGKYVDVVMVPGNHDPDENFKLGEYLRAWYRHAMEEGRLTIVNTPTQNKYVGWGSNTLMLTHGEHYMKKGAGNPILTFATECPIDLWAMSAGPGGCREILSGHLHARRRGQYTPTSDVTEEKAIVTRSLPGLVVTDKWHDEMGYGHRRAGTLIVYKESGGPKGEHEVRP